MGKAWVLCFCGELGDGQRDFRRLVLEELKSPVKGRFEVAVCGVFYKVQSPTALSRLEIIPPASVQACGGDTERSLVSKPNLVIGCQGRVGVAENNLNEFLDPVRQRFLNLP